MNPDRTLVLQVINRHRNALPALPRRYSQQHVNVVRDRLAFQQFDVILTARLPKNPANVPSPSSKKLLPGVFWQDAKMILAVPFHVGMT